MRIPEISDSEWIIMETLWKKAPQTASEIARELQSSKKWALNTVRTLLTRLVDKRALKINVNASGTRIFFPAITREDCVKAESKSFLQRVFRGAAKPLLVHFVQNNDLTPEEVRKLKRLLDESLKK